MRQLAHLPHCSWQVRQVGVLVGQFNFSLHEERYCLFFAERSINFQLNCIGLDYFGKATASFASL